MQERVQTTQETPLPFLNNIEGIINQKLHFTERLHAKKIDEPGEQAIITQLLSRCHESPTLKKSGLNKITKELLHKSGHKGKNAVLEYGVMQGEQQQSPTLTVSAMYITGRQESSLLPHGQQELITLSTS
ncbi:hypothetical protein DPMN_137978 [Dreissena polymorpha]|uniref:Uncharacterized protein n=1 Tax=Dreissena polymorpha TaxID=45954 RepID=A0A9D4G2W9_DREPO|nr:hypothetical protein DPMN_137978 [Dreissena polymorpha]